MKRKKTYTFYILSNHNKPVRQITFSRRHVGILAAICLIVVTVTALGLFEYTNVRHRAATAQALEGQLQQQRQQVAEQRQQIQKFARDIDTIKSQLLTLNSFEKKIRIIANLEKDAQNNGLFGMGGSAPDDLNPSLPLNRTHNTLVREMHDHTRQLQVATGRQANGFESLLKKLENQVDMLACTPSIRPSRGWVTSRFGHRTSPFTGRREFHKALDIANRLGTPIIATADGRISYSGRKGLLGKVIVIDHGHGFNTTYAHCDKLLKKRGERVKRGETIALMGSTGRSTGPHLHYEVRASGVRVNPEKYILD